MQFALQDPCLEPGRSSHPSVGAGNPYRARRAIDAPTNAPRRRKLMEATGNRIEPGRVIGEAFETYQNQVTPLLGGGLIVIGIAGVIEGILAITGSFVLVLLGLLVGLAASFLYTGYVVKLVQDV